MAENTEKDPNTTAEDLTSAPAATEPSEAPASAAVAAEAGTTPPAPASEGDEGAAAVSVDSAAAPEPAAAVEPPEPKEDWRDKRIAQLTAKLAGFRAAGAAPTPAAPVADPSAPPTYTAEDVNAAAARMVAQQRFVDSCNDAARAGRTAYPNEFDARLGQLKQLVDGNDPAEAAAYNTLLGALIETGEAPRLLYELGGDPNNAAKLLGMAAQSPVKLAVELTKMAMKKGEAEPSRAPKPITPIQSSITRNPIDPTDKAKADTLSTAEWMKRREADVAAKQKAGARIS